MVSKKVTSKFFYKKSLNGQALEIELKEKIT